MSELVDQKCRGVQRHVQGLFSILETEPGSSASQTPRFQTGVKWGVWPALALRDPHSVPPKDRQCPVGLGQERGQLRVGGRPLKRSPHSPECGGEALGGLERVLQG